MCENGKYEICAHSLRTYGYSDLTNVANSIVDTNFSMRLFSVDRLTSFIFHISFVIDLHVQSRESSIMTKKAYLIDSELELSK